MHVRARCAGNGQQVKVTFQNYEQLVGGSKRFRNRSPAEEYQSTHTHSFSLGRASDAAETDWEGVRFCSFGLSITQRKDGIPGRALGMHRFFAAEKPIREKCTAATAALAHLDLREVPAD
jgi:hypothetical protein